MKSIIIFALQISFCLETYLYLTSKQEKLLDSEINYILEIYLLYLVSENIKINQIDLRAIYCQKYYNEDKLHKFERFVYDILHTLIQQKENYNEQQRILKTTFLLHIESLKQRIFNFKTFFYLKSLFESCKSENCLQIWYFNYSLFYLFFSEIFFHEMVDYKYKYSFLEYIMNFKSKYYSEVKQIKKFNDISKDLHSSILFENKSKTKQKNILFLHIKLFSIFLYKYTKIILLFFESKNKNYNSLIQNMEKNLDSKLILKIVSENIQKNLYNLKKVVLEKSYTLNFDANIQIFIDYTDIFLLEDVIKFFHKIVFSGENRISSNISKIFIVNYKKAYIDCTNLIFKSFFLDINKYEMDLYKKCQTIDQNIRIYKIK